jgi:hypothetical protein
VDLGTGTRWQKIVARVAHDKYIVAVDVAHIDAGVVEEGADTASRAALPESPDAARAIRDTR